ncbi:unnamed protein product [Danaus chrysippus]|uniref:(African queen) hypothetical protein n=1 Tax=Danaus chrysippus TaxID=151541 RepID=A0A8J2VR04_9NEOP|nr:unnamed protein product [Danaus chrysippus]
MVPHVPFTAIGPEAGKLENVDGIKYVINFDYPNSSEDYIHRIGRTGRSKSKGTSYAFFTPSNSRQAKDLVSVLQEANQVVSPQLQTMADRCGGGGGGGWNRNRFGGGRGGGSFKRGSNFGRGSGGQGGGGHKRFNNEYDY